MRFLAIIGLLAICAAVTGACYFLAGFYNVAASHGGNPVIDWAVAEVSEASIEKHVRAPPTPVWFGEPKTTEAGARQFVEEGCVKCHGGPGAKPDKFALGMEPRPADLNEVGSNDEPAHIFWAVKNGIRMTGMPAFGNHLDDKEIWRTVAFIKQMKDVSPAQFKRWSAAHDPEALKMEPAPTAEPTGK